MTTALSETPSTPSTRKPSQGGRVIKFIQDHCVHPDGRWLGQPIRLQPWQRKLIYDLFLVGGDGLRRNRWALIGEPKKTGKTTLAACLALYFLLADGEPSPLVVCAAASDDQADLVFGAAKTMVKMSPTLSQLCTPFDKEIQVRDQPGARLRRVSAVAGTNDGLNIHAAILDELHEWTGPKGEAVWNVLTNGTGARSQPMVLQITTAGYDLEGTICGRQYSYGKRVQSGDVEDERYFFHWDEAPEGVDHRDPEVWRAANPNFGVTVQEAFFQDQLTKKTESVFRRYFLNQWVAGADLWLPYGAWDACRSELDLDLALPVCVGIDIALRNDSTAVVIAQRQQHEMGERTVVRAKVWENPYPEGHTLHDSWELNIFEVEQHLTEFHQRFPVPACEIDGEVKPGPEFSYDPMFFERSAQVLEGDGLAMVEYPQHDSRMIAASQSLYQLVVEGKLAHDGDPVLKRHIESATADQKPRGWRLTKPKGSRRKIDAGVSCAIASFRAQQEPPKTRRSVYEDRGMVTA
jgi:phage terminase large subunit-like protein